MKKFFATLIAASLLVGISSVAYSAEGVDVGPKVEVTFVLDTTSSMSQLIEGAQQKIWAIARRMASGRPAPTIKIGLIGFRDRGDEYVTRPYDLTEDIDLMYGNLIGFRAAGGYDLPESVNQALYEAVTKVSWNKDPKTLKIIFLVGDAPPHMDYPDDVKYPEVIELAKKAGIIINTIQCGRNAQTTPIWVEIAQKAGGAFVQIDQSGGMTAVATPMDAELARLSRELARTAVPYGNAAKQSEVRSKTAAADTADTERIVFLNLDRADFGAKAVVTGSGELVWDVVNRKVKLEEIPEVDFPVILQGKTLQERTVFITEQVAKRKDLQVKVDELAKQRDVHIKTEMTKLSDSTRDSFDAKVAEMIHAQALSRGIEYDISTPSEKK
jgi:hypothetical protein